MPLCVTHLSAPIMQAIAGAQRRGKRERERSVSMFRQLCLTPWAPQTWGKENLGATWQIPFLCDHHGMPSCAVWKEASLENWMGNCVHPSFLHRKWRLRKRIWFTQSYQNNFIVELKLEPRFPESWISDLFPKAGQSWKFIPDLSSTGYSSTLVLLNRFKCMKNPNWYPFMYLPVWKGWPPCCTYQKKSKIRSYPRDTTRNKRFTYMGTKSWRSKWNCQYFQGL